MNNEEARTLYRESGITYNDIGSKEISLLRSLIRVELVTYNKKPNSELEMKLCTLKPGDIHFDENGCITDCYLMVDGFYFHRREAISFNLKNNVGVEFIGFAGWASTYNTAPFIDAFVKWLDKIKK